MIPWVECPKIEIDLDRPLAERYNDVPVQAFVHAKRLLDAVISELPAGLGYLADMIRLRTVNRFHGEICALADQVGAEWRDIMLANVSYDMALATIGCSTVALASTEGPVLARNMDWWPEDLLAQTSYLIHNHRDNQLAYANAGWPGAVGVVSGMSGRGFGLTLNAVTCDEGINKTGYPVLLYLRKVLEDAGSFEEAIDMLTDTKLAAPCLITVIGIDNHERVVVERTPTRAMQRWCEGDKPLIITNDYRLLDQPQTSDAAEIYMTTCLRYESLLEHFAGYDANRTLQDNELLYALTEPDIMQSITAQHVVMCPRTQHIRLFVPRHLLSAA